MKPNTACRAALALLLGISLASCAAKPRAAEGTEPAGEQPQADSRASAPAAAMPILYHRTGGIAATDDRVVIWPDGKVEVDGRLMTDATVRVPQQRFDRLVSLLSGWDGLDDSYVATNVADAYLIRIYYGGKVVEATDINPNLPKQFRDVYTEIESIAAQAANAEPKPVSP